MDTRCTADVAGQARCSEAEPEGAKFQFIWIRPRATGCFLAAVVEERFEESAQFKKTGAVIGHTVLSNALRGAWRLRMLGLDFVHDTQEPCRLRLAFNHTRLVVLPFFGKFLGWRSGADRQRYVIDCSVGSLQVSRRKQVHWLPSWDLRQQSRRRDGQEVDEPIRLPLATSGAQPVGKARRHYFPAWFWHHALGAIVGIIVMVYA